MQIIPAILSSDPGEVRRLLEKIKKARKFSRVQVDFVGRPFAKERNLVVGRVEVERFRPLLADAHLMTNSRDLEMDIVEASCVGFDRIIAQAESINDQKQFLEWTERCKRGVAVDLDTDVSGIDALMRGSMDVILLMAVKAGRGGQKFDERVIEKIRQIGEMRRIGKYKFKICVDGGVEKEHLGTLENLGVDEVAVGAKRVLGWEERFL